jgi:hypothetical protein
MSTMRTAQQTITVGGEVYSLGERVSVETTDGKVYRLPISEIVGDRCWLDDGKVRLQLDASTGQILVLVDPDRGSPR